MEPILNCISFFVIFSIIDTSFSAVYLDFVDKSPKDHYLHSRDANVHRGFLLSLSPDEKEDICLDSFSDKLDIRIIGAEALSLILTDSSQQTIEVTDDSTSQKESVFPIIVRPIRAIGAHYAPTDREDIFLKCVLKNYPTPMAAAESERFVSWAYQPGLMYQGSEWDEKGRSDGISMRQYFLLSPEIISYGETDLEKQYLRTRQVLKNLERESAEYIHLVDRKDTISTLSVWQTFILCSLVSSATFEQNRHQVSLNWRKYKERTESESYSKYQRLGLSFRNQVYRSQGWTADCVFCTTIPSDAIDPSAKSKNVFVTRDFDDPMSVYVLIELNGAVSITEHAKNVPVLANARVPATDDPLIIQDTD